MERIARTLYLYDPRTNVSTEITYKYLEEFTGSTRNTLSSMKTSKKKIRSIGCYLIDCKTTLKERQELYAKENFPDESWKEVSGSDGIYLISNHGRFKKIHKHTEPRFIMPVFRKQNGHLYVKVRFNNNYKTYKISHLVARHFIGLNHEKYSVRHKNGIKTDCFSGNLEYITKQKLGKLTGAYSMSKPVVQLDAETMEPIDEYRSVREAGRKTFLSHQAVLDNCHGKTKVAAGVFKFMFLDDYEKALGW